MADLRVRVGDVGFKNPIVVSSGEPTTDFEHMKKAIEAGAGAVIAKSIAFSPELAESYKHARWSVIDEDRELCKNGKFPKMYSFYGRGGIPLEPRDWMETLKRVQKVADSHGAVLIGSVASGPIEKIVDAAKRMEKAGIKIIELDAGCPQAGELKYNNKEDLVTSADIAKYQAKSIVDAVSVPVIYKVAAEDVDKMATCKAVKDAGVAAVTLMNRFSGFLVDIENGRPHINSWAGVGGPWMLPLTLRWVSRVHQAEPKLQILGSNGAKDWKDAVQFLMSGTTLACYCTEVMLRGYKLISQNVQGLDRFLDEKGYKSVEEIIGLAVKNAKSYEDLYSSQQKAVVNKELCKKCGKCAQVCFYEALSLTNGIPEINEECKGCGLCVAACPNDSINLK